MHTEITFLPLASADEKTLIQMLSVRNEEGVRKWMYTDHVISADEHNNWVIKTKADGKQVVFVILNKDDVLGMVSLNAIDHKHKKADWAYYVTHSSRGGIGAAIEYAFINYVFNTIGLEKLNCEVIEGNNAVVKLHEKFGFKVEGFRRENIIKQDERLGVHFLGLTKNEWNERRELIYNTYSAILDKFVIEIK